MNKAQMRVVTRVLKPLLASDSLLHSRNGKQRMILMYHGISTRPRFNCISQGLFKDQLVWLKEHYVVVPLSELVESLQDEGRYESNLVSLTFDDGYVNFAELALPLLKEHRIHATLFVPSGKVGGDNNWDEGTSGYEKMSLLSYEDLRQLPEEFVEVGSHGISHTPLNCLPQEAAERELMQSKMDIEWHIGRRVRFLAFPHGRSPAGWYSRFRGNGREVLHRYDAVCTTHWGRFNSRNTINALRRVAIWEPDSFGDFLDKLNGYYDWLIAKENIGRFFRSAMSGS